MMEIVSLPGCALQNLAGVVPPDLGVIAADKDLSVGLHHEPDNGGSSKRRGQQCVARMDPSLDCAIENGVLPPLRARITARFRRRHNKHNKEE